MKKTLSLLLALLCVLGCIAPAMADERSSGYTFTFGGTTVKEDSTSVEVRGKSSDLIYISDREMRNLVRYCPDLEKLVLDYCYMDDDTYQRIGGLTELKNLRLMSTTGNPLEDISFLEDLTKLTNLDLCYNAISDLTPMEGLTKLTSTNLGGNKIGNDALYSLAELPSLKKLYLHSNQITSITALRDMENLQLLNIQKNKNLKSFTALKTMPKLGTLYIQNTGCTNLSFVEDCYSLTEINIAGCPLDYDEYEELTYSDSLVTVTIGTSDDITVDELYDMLGGYVKVTDGKTTLPTNGKLKTRSSSSKKATATPKAKATATPKAKKTSVSADYAPLYTDGYAVHRNGKKITSVSSLRVGDIVTFGSYVQGGSSERNSLEWEVLEISGKEVMLISARGIAAVPYHDAYEDICWEDSFLRTWLNSSFYMNAFTESERKMILSQYVETEKNPDYKKSDPGNGVYDNVFVLDRAEIEEYFPDEDDRLLVATDTAINKGASVTYDNECFWWTRTPGSSNHCNCVVDNDGSFYNGTHVDRMTTGKMGCARPCVWIKF